MSWLQPAYEIFFNSSDAVTDARCTLALLCIQLKISNVGMMIDCSNAKIIIVDFGRVNPGAVAKRTFNIRNESCKTQCYEVYRDPTTDPLDRVFTLEFYNWTLLPGDFMDCKIEYRPVLPFHHNFDYFNVTNCEHECYKISVRGISTGPNVVPSTLRIAMVCSKEACSIKTRLQLSNKSELAAVFMFDVDESNSPFKLDFTRGTIEPNSRRNITITFSPLRHKLYAFHLSCLILHQEPVVVELYGYQGPSFSKADELAAFVFTDPKPQFKGFKGYMSDTATALNGSQPLITVSDNSLNFDCRDCIAKQTFQCVSNICLTNHSTIDMTIKWDKDVENNFEIKPCVATICGQKCCLFEVHFCPNKHNTLFARELLAYAFWENTALESSSTAHSSIPIPVIVSVRMIGQSFSPGTIGWIPQYEVPRTVIMPPCLPQCPTYTTFLIKLYGHLPMTFRFVPPLTTHFAVKPMVGIIHREYQIVALQLFPKFPHDHVYVEQWMILFNGNSTNEVPIEFRAHAEYPKLDFDNSNRIQFAPVQSQCEEVTKVTMRNSTRHCIRYVFRDLPSEISIEKTNGIIQANEILTHEWIFHPKDAGDYRYTISCSVQMFKAHHPVKLNIDVPLTVTGKAQLGFLVALPKELNFGSIACGQTRVASFYMYNFSSVKIHYKLTCKQLGWPIGNIVHDIRIQPALETILPASNEKIDIYTTPHEPGFYQLMVQYSLRSSSLSNDSIYTTQSRDICTVNYLCILPEFEIFTSTLLNNSEYDVEKVELIANGKIITPFYPLYTECLPFSFNGITKSIVPGDKRVINLRFPEMVLSEEPLLIKLFVGNSTPACSTWTLKRVKICDCKQLVKSRGLTFKYKEYSCNHRRACILSPKNGTIQPRSQVIITIKICYVILGKTSLRWQLELSNNRNLIINADVVALSNRDACPSLLINQVLSMEKSYIGNLDASNQMCWMYNSLYHNVVYSLDVSPLHHINTANLSEIFLCRNPQGNLRARSYYPLMFKFQPRQFDSYQVTLPLKLGDTLTNLSITAESDVLPKTKCLLIKSPCIHQFSVPEVSIYFSVDHIVVYSMPTHSKIKRMLTISNESKNDVIGYQWKSYVLPNILEITVIPASGRIQPKKAQSFCVTISSHMQPCQITADLPCQFLNLSAQRMHERKVIMYNSLCGELSGQFTITESGIKEPKAWLEGLEKPKPFYKSLSISCYIYSSVDADLTATVGEQLKSLPTAEIPAQKNTSCKYVTTKKQINIAAFILEGMIWEIINSNIFVNTLKESLIKVPNVKYGQYKIPLTKRRKLQNRSYNIPPLQYLESILEKMIFGIVHQEFGISLFHFDHPGDMRQFWYQKRDTQILNRDELQNSSELELTKQLGSKDVKNAESNELRNESQVRFNIQNDQSSHDSGQ